MLEKGKYRKNNDPERYSDYREELRLIDYSRLLEAPLWIQKRRRRRRIFFYIVLILGLILVLKLLLG